MRNLSIITMHKGTQFKTRGSAKFTNFQSFSNFQPVEGRDRKINWLNYKWAVGFTLAIGVPILILLMTMF